MKSILEYIEQKKRELAQTPFLAYIADSSIEPRKRFAFVPCIAPFAMAYTDINKYILRDDASSEPLQQIINTHSREEDSHWRMYLRDLRALDMDATSDLGQVLKLLWGDDCRRTRQMVYELTSLFLRHEDLRMRLVLVEAIEGTADVAFKVFSRAAGEFEQQTGRRLHYFGMTHEILEASHSLTSESEVERLSAVEIPAEMEPEALKAVEKVYELFCIMFDELLEYAKAADTRAQQALAAQAWQKQPERAPETVVA
jgi:hypothetical protein